MRRTLLLWIGLSTSACAPAQTGPVYYDFIDSAKAAADRHQPRAAQQFYENAFERRPALVQHALGYARICWSLKDTAKVNAYVAKALDLGVSGPELEMDSVLSPYWSSRVAENNRMLWRKYAAMIMPELKAELEAMFKEDQDIRKALDWQKADSPDSLVRRSVWIPVEAQDQRHLERVIAIIKEHGVPSVHQVGLVGNKMIFFAFIHARDVDTISAYALQLSRSVRNGDSPAIWYAYVIDRIMVKTSKETMFATTGYFNPADDTYYFTAVVPKYVDLLREEMGLPREGRNQE